MRIGLLAIACLISSVTALPSKPDLGERDLSAINRSNQRITNSLNAFITAVRNRLKGGDQNEARRQTDRLLGLARQIATDGRQGAREVRSGPQVAYLEGMNLLGPVTNLGTLITTAANGWTDKNVQEMVKAAGMRNDVLKVLKDTEDAMKEYGDAIVGKLPVLDLTGPIAGAITQSYISLVSDAIKVYSRSW